MIEEVLPNLYRTEVPLPKNPLKSLNSYVIKGNERFLIIDTGMNRQECLRPMLANLKELKVNLSKADLFITHFHSDHLGLVADVAMHGSRIYFNQIEASFMHCSARDKPWDQLSAFYLSNGFPADELERAMRSHPGDKYAPKKHVEFHIVKESDKISIGDYSFNCISTPGHTPGHMCLYEADKKVLIAGDHILFDITPNITHWPQMADSLREYLASLDKVYPLDVHLVLPGHRSLMNNHRSRIKELHKHHESRLKEVIVALEDGDKTAWEVAPHITWDIEAESWEQFPPPQKWFAVGETIAHLIYLETDKKIRRRIEDGNLVFSLER